MSLNPGKLYEKLLNHFGKQYWWPVDRRYHEEKSCDERLEIMIGAILTQNTAWTNVEKALNNLKKHNCLDTQSILSINDSDLKRYIQPSGFFNQKAERLKTLTIFLENNYQSDLDLFFSQDLHKLREELLALKGIGPETADSILALVILL
jgi:endonuclease-3 related protein